MKSYSLGVSKGILQVSANSAPDLDSEIKHELPPHPWDYRTIFVLLVVHLGAAFAPFHFSWSALAAMFVLYAATAMGITLGYHRLLTHKSFTAPTWLRHLFVTCVALSAQAGPASWVAIHRQHHANSDKENDPHDASRGFWWCHIGWMLKLTPKHLDEDWTARFAPDIVTVPYYRYLDRHFFLLTVISHVGLWLIGGWSWLFWAGFVRVAAVFHATWLVNSAAHAYGYRNFETNDRSTNCWWVALLTFGEGWHNNHHAFPRSARHGMKWWEVDISWTLLCLLEKIGLVQRIKLPTHAQLKRYE